MIKAMPGPIRFLLVLLLLCPMTGAVSGQQRIANDLIGTYIYGFQWGGSRLTLKSDGTFIWESSNCTSVYKNSGSYSSSEGHLELIVLKKTLTSFGDGKEIDLRKPKARKKFLDTDEPFKQQQIEMAIIKWDTRIYLMDTDRFESFVDAINLGFEPRHVETYRPFFGEILLREGDEQKDVAGTPSLPNEFLSKILKSPITSTVTDIESDGNKTIATVDRGSKDGLRKGMTLIKKSEDGWFTFQGYWIISVDEQSAKVQVWEVKVGDQLTTRVKDVLRYARYDTHRLNLLMAAVDPPFAPQAQVQ
jgi:hypothetical protein